MKSATASYCDNATRSGKRLGSGTARGGTLNSCSPRICNVIRLVTITLRRVQAARRSATCTAASITCSKLSSSSKSCLSCRDVFSRLSSGCSPVSLRSSVWAMVGTTNSGSLMGARFTKYTPSEKWSLSSAATCTPRRVLPVPPGPVRVSKRTSSRRSNAATAATSCSRPMSGVGWTGKLLGYASSVLRGGKPAGKPAMTS